MPIGKRLREWLHEQRIPSRELAQKLELTEGAVSSILSGKNNMSNATFLKLLETYPDLCPRWLMLGDDGIHKGRCSLASDLGGEMQLLRDENAMLKDMIGIQNKSLESKEMVINLLAKIAT